MAEHAGHNHHHDKSTHRHEHDDEQACGIDTVEHLVEHLGEAITPSSAIIGVGNDICGDDALGAMVAQRLLEYGVPWDVYDTQGVPESFLMKIVSRKPESVIVVDALHFAAPVGTVDLFEPEMITGQGPSTHGPAPVAFLDMLQMMHPCRCWVLGVQPAKVDFGCQMCPQVAAAADMIVEGFRSLADKSRAAR